MITEKGGGEMNHDLRPKSKLDHFFWSFNKNAEVKLETAALAIIINSLNSSAVKLMFTTQKYKVYIVCGHSFFHYLKKLNFWPASETEKFWRWPLSFHRYQK